MDLLRESATGYVGIIPASAGAAFKCDRYGTIANANTDALKLLGTPCLGRTVVGLAEAQKGSGEMGKCQLEASSLTELGSAIDRAVLRGEMVGPVLMKQLDGSSTMGYVRPVFEDGRVCEL